MDQYARIQSGKTQTIKEHLEGVERRVEGWAPKSLRSTSRLIARLHDLGKYHPDWQEYLKESSAGNNPKTVPHAPLGAYAVYRLINECGKVQDSMTTQFVSDVLVYVILAHHGVFDALSPDGHQALTAHLSRYNANGQWLLNESFDLFSEDFNWIDLKILFEETYEELTAFLQQITSESAKEHFSPFFSTGALVRILLSLLIDADWSDASAEISGEAQWNRFKEQVNYETYYENLMSRLATFSERTDLSDLRKLISDESEKASSFPTGIYRLNVPTGGGKTLSVMRFALQHAMLQGKRRIIYTAPYNTILDQTGIELRKSLLGGESDTSDWEILEHHGDVLRNAPANGPDDIHELLLSNWDSPIILTTVVQLLNTLITSSKRSIRRSHRLTNSIIILDEFQKIPIKSMAMFHYWLNILSAYFGATIILCTATQPPFEEMIKNPHTHKALPPVKYQNPCDLVPDFSGKKAFQRTTIHDKCRNRGYSLDEAAVFIREAMIEVRSMLVILNTRGAARDLYEVMNRDYDLEVVLLSNNMIPAHRKNVIESIKKRLEDTKSEREHPKKILVISTALIEAGVDISFDRVIRSLTGLDSIVQAAGRCNRHGGMSNGDVLIINPMDTWENTSKLEEVSIAQKVMGPLLRNYEENPDAYGYSLMSSKAVSDYFLAYYQQLAGLTQYPVKVGFDSLSIFEMLDTNQTYRKRARSNRSVINQSFRTAGDLYEPIESATIGVLVPWGEGKDLINQLGSEKKIENLGMMLRKVQQYSVEIYSYQLELLKERGGVFATMDSQIWVLQENFYTEETGLNLLGIVNQSHMF